MTSDVVNPLSVLFLGASFGTVLGMRIAAAGHRVTFACREQEATLINNKKLFLRVPAKEHKLTLEIGPSQCHFSPEACVPDDVDPQAFDLVCLAMQEPQYSAPGVRDLLYRVAKAQIPCLSIMNIPLPPFLERIATLDDQTSQSVFTEAALWKQFDPSVFTMASADPQSMRVDNDDALITSVTLPTNFKVAPFELAQHQLLLEQLARDVDACRIESAGFVCQPRVRLRPHASNFVPLAKWPMLITGNFRCMTSGAPVSIGEAVSNNESESREIYEWILQVCLALGVEESTLVPFNSYLAAAKGLSLPSSLARGLYAGATAVERVDKLILALARGCGMTHKTLERIVTEVSAMLEKNRAR